jgi:cysteine sulfinate desulfinase/cysteine desulfurase-like protein
MGLGKSIVQGAIRLSLSWETSEEQVLAGAEKIIRVVRRLRAKR